MLESTRDGAQAAVRLTHATLSRDDIVADFRLGFRSRRASLTGRREVMSGKAKFGIFGDGKEVAQLAMARAFRPGDWRSLSACSPTMARSTRCSATSIG